MAIANFEAFCAGFCDIAGIAPPELVPDACGALAFTVRMHGVPVTAMQVRSRLDAVHLIAELGAAPPAQPLLCWRALLEANLALLARLQPAFSCNPDTGEVVLQRTFLLWDLIPADAWMHMDMLAGMACQWREGSLPSGPLAVAADGQGAPLWGSSFEALHDGVRQLPGVRVGPLVRDADGRHFAFDLDGVAITVLHAPGRGADCALVKVAAGAPDATHEEDELAQILEMNFRAMTLNHSPVIGRDPVSANLFFLYSFPLPGAEAREFLETAGAVAQCMADAVPPPNAKESQCFLPSANHLPDEGPANQKMTPSQRPTTQHPASGLLTLTRAPLW